MKRVLLSGAAALALAAALMLTSNLPAASAAQPAREAHPKMAAAKGLGNQTDPDIRYALTRLKEAKQGLANARSVFQGHRAMAIKHVDQAIEECNKALALGK